MLITKASLSTLFLGLNLTMNRALAAPGTTLYQDLCMRSTSTGKVEQYPFLGDLPIVEEKEEGVPSKILNLIPSDFQIPNLDMERIIGIKQNDLEDDKQGLYTTRIQEVGEGTGRALDYMLARRMTAFTKQKDYTGKYFFDTDKVINEGSTETFSNKGTKKLSAANFETGLQSIHERADAQGVSLNLAGVKTMLVVSSRNRALGIKIVESKLVGGGDDNPNFGACDLRVWGHLDKLSPDSWFIFAYGGVRKPFILQERVPFKTSMTTDPNDSYVLKNGEFLYKIKGRLNISAGESLMAYGSTGADAA